ncbi:torsin-1A-like isoform X2 [Ischnura elegans]|uniref:torsin-1A-like isoform X2 n=1 Tax=Ischnura elegans TaxID=197161 RepID=UPI001ED8752E|nr:torsin-1A-like isoform X2 [Ischnura elegans]
MLRLKFYVRSTRFFVLPLLLLPLWFSGSHGLFELITSAVSRGFQSIGSLYCKGVTCCDFHLNDDVEDRLNILLRTKLYGQHIAKSLVLEAVSSHRRHKPQKALGMGLHGWTGTGKNYVSQMIAESLYKEGMHSPLVHVYAGRATFPIDAEVDQYKKDLLGWISRNVSRCGQSLFIFDEADKMPATLLDVVKPFLDYHAVIGGIDYRHAIFLFLSNSGGSPIGTRMLELHEEGILRDDMKFEDFHGAIASSLFNQHGGFFRGDIIRGDGIDFHIPFLPLEEKHVRLCAEHQFRLRNYYYPTEKMIREVLDNMQYGPESIPIFSMTGCKHVKALVTSAISRLKLEL